MRSFGGFYESEPVSSGAEGNGLLLVLGQQFPLRFLLAPLIAAGLTQLCQLQPSHVGPTSGPPKPANVWHFKRYASTSVR